MLRTNAFRFAQFAIMLFALHSALVGEVFADQASDRCVAVRSHCENGEANCSWLRNALKQDGIVCPGVDTPSTATTTSTTSNMSPEDAKRCQSAAAVCTSDVGDPAFCMAYKRNFTLEGLSCPGVNAPSLSATSGAPSMPAYTSSGPAHVEPSLQYARSSNPGDTLANIQAECADAHGHGGFGSQVKCIKSGIQNSGGLATADSGDVQLYVLTADKLVDDVARKHITVAAARVELQKAFLEFRERTNRKNADASNRAYTARLEAQAQQAEVQRRQAAADAEARAELAARQNAQAQADAQIAAIQNCVALAHERQQAAYERAQNPGVRAGLGLAFGGNTAETACQRDPNWYRTILVPPPVQRSHCQSDLLGGYNCTSQ